VLKSSNRAFGEFSAASTAFWDNRLFLAPTRRYRNRSVLAAFPPVFANLRLSKPWRAHHKEQTGFSFWLHLRGTDVIFHVPMQRAVAISMEQNRQNTITSNETCFRGSLPQDNFSHLYRSLPFPIQGQNGPLLSGLLSDQSRKTFKCKSGVATYLRVEGSEIN